MADPARKRTWLAHAFLAAWILVVLPLGVHEAIVHGDAADAPVPASRPASAPATRPSQARGPWIRAGYFVPLPALVIEDEGEYQ